MNPDDKKSATQSHVDELGFVLNNNGSSVINKGWFKSLNWTASFTYTDKKSHFESQATNALNLYSTAMEDGLVYTNIPGLNISDIDGKQITSFPEGSQVKGTVLPYSYLYQYDIFGRELNGFAKFNLNFGKSWDTINEKILVGADYKVDGNLGKGAVYQDDTPPYRSGSTASGYRRRPYTDIPFVHQIGAYLENNFDWTFASRKFVLSAGVRFDCVNGKTSLAPRINASLDLIPGIMTIRGGWGITSKAPTSIYLYPNPAYHDMVNYNGMSVNTPEAERLLVATTKVYDVTNKDLEIAKNRKAEIGLDFTIAHKYRISVTAYDELMKNGYTFSQSLSSFKYTPVTLYEIAQAHPGAIPTLRESEHYNIFFQTYEPGNSLRLANKGVEYEIDFGRFDPIRTSLTINGAWMRSTSRNNDYSFSTRSTAASLERNIGVYEKGLQTSFVDNFNTTFRITHNIPKIGFVITLTSQVNWYTKMWTEYGNDTMFEKYISYKDGQVHDFDPLLRNDPDFNYLFPTLNDNRFIKEKYFPTVIFNLNLSKEVGDWLTASFYVNNLINSRPMYRSKATGSISELGIPIFFGLELKITIK